MPSPPRSSLRLPITPHPEPAPFKHLIADYVHRVQQVRCTCGWVGSSASPEGHGSAWHVHLAQMRGPNQRRH